MIEILDDRFYFGFWWASAGPDYDWLCVVWREEDRVCGRYRHRFGSVDDRRSWYTFGGQLKPNAEVCGDADVMLDAIVELANATGFVPPGTTWSIQKNHVCAMGDVFEAAFSACDFVHKRQVSDGELDEIEREIAAGRPC